MSVGCFSNFKGFSRDWLTSRAFVQKLRCIGVVLCLLRHCSEASGLSSKPWKYVWVQRLPVVAVLDPYLTSFKHTKLPLGKGDLKDYNSSRKPPLNLSNTTFRKLSFSSYMLYVLSGWCLEKLCVLKFGTEPKQEARQRHLPFPLCGHSCLHPDPGLLPVVSSHQHYPSSSLCSLIFSYLLS